MDKINVAWSAVIGAANYDVYRDSGSGAIKIGSVIAPVATFTDTTASVGVVYTYTIIAKAGASTSAMSPGNSGFKGISAPSAVAASDGEFENSILVKWSPVVGATAYEVFRDAVKIGDVLGGVIVSFSDINTTAVAANINYTYTVKALVVSGATIKVSPVSIGNTGWRGPAPKNVVASDALYSERIDITWTKLAGATTYKVWRAIGAAVATEIPVTPVVSGNSVTAKDTSAVAGTIYTYTVRAMLPLGLGPVSKADTGSRKSTSGLVDGHTPSGTAGASDQGVSGADIHQHAGANNTGAGNANGTTNTNGQVDGADDQTTLNTRTMAQMQCDELFLKITDRIDAAQTQLDAIRSQGIMNGAQSTVVNASVTERMLKELIDKLTRDDDMNGVIDACQRAAGDFDLDGAVDDFDMVDFDTAFEMGDLNVADLNCDGELDSADFGCMLNALQSHDAPSATIE